MSATTNPEAPKPAVQAANSPADVVRAMRVDPDLSKIVLNGVGAVLAGNKSLLGTRSFWVNTLTPLVTWGVTKYALELDADTQVIVVGALGAAVAAGMRWITKAPVTSVLPAALTAPV
jgi:hypothetical protein